MEKQSKLCLYCSQRFFKKINESKRAWEFRTKFCSKVCMNNSRVGIPSWNKGIPMRNETKEKLALSLKGHTPWNKNLKGVYKLGSPSEETRLKISLSQKGKKRNKPAWNKGLKGLHIPWNKGKKVPQSSGDKNPNWKGGITPINQQIRTSLEYKLWRKAVFERDEFTCQICEKRGVKLNADHIKRFSDYPDLRLNLKNGRTLCESCHKKTDTYGLYDRSLTTRN